MSASSGLHPLPLSENHEPLSSVGVAPDQRPGQLARPTSGDCPQNERWAQAAARFLVARNRRT